MTLQAVERWFNALPAAERSVPLVMLDGVAYSPVMVLDEVRRGTPNGQRLQRMVEGGSLGTLYEDVWRLAKERLKIRLSAVEEKPLFALMQIPVRTLTPSQLMEEVERETQLGQRFIRAELEHMSQLLRVR